MKKGDSYNKWIISIVILIIVILFLVFFQSKGVNVKNSENDEIIRVIDKGEIKVTKDGTKYIVDPSKIISGGPPKGGIGVEKGIPALAKENINFVSVAEADLWIEDNELVLALEYKGVKRVYPLQILVFHEIVNDDIAGDPILITYCPLCGSGIAYERTIKIEGERIETRFGTSGKLYNSNLIMYDEETDTYWQQIDGLAILGKLTGQELIEISIDTVTWGNWKEFHSDTEVLSQNTGMTRNYGNDPYGNYYEESYLLFNVENSDDRIFAKDLVFGIEINGEYKAYRQKDVKEKTFIEDSVNGVNIKLELLNDGRVIVKNVDTGEKLVKEVDFWFAWYAFHPETELYGF